MDLKKLYSDVTVLVGEIPVYSFLTYCDMCARSLISKYGKRCVIGEGEYLTPENISEPFSVDEAFYNAVLLYISGQSIGDGAKLEKSAEEAERAYISIWRRNSAGKRIKGAKW